MGTKLENIIKERGMTIRQFALQAGVSYATVYDAVTGRRPIDGMNVRHAEAIAHALGMSIEELLGHQMPMLSADEAELIGLWRQMPTMGKRMVLGVARQIVQEAAEDGED